MVGATLVLATLLAAPQGGGAVDPAAAREFWAFRPPREAPVPEVKDRSWPRSGIDRFVRARQEQAGVQVNPDADRRTLIRRASLDLTGLPPTPAEVEAFVADDGPDAFAKVVDRLLASPRFGERWARHWLDVVRFAESTGRTRNFAFPVAWRYRNYVIDAFNADKPYDVFVTEQLAGDLLPPSGTAAERNTRKVATGFLAIGSKDLNERNRQQYLMDQADDQIDVTCRAFMGLTVACARCHDHKFDPIPTRDYYALAGIFRSTDLLDGYANRSGGNRNYGKGDRYHRLDLPGIPAQGPAAGATSPRRKPAQRRADKRIAEIEAQLKELSARQARSGGKRADLKRIRQQTGQLRKELRRLANGNQNKKGRGAQPALTGNEAMGVRDGARPADMPVLVRGDVATRGDTVPRGFLRVLLPPQGLPAELAIGSGESGRLQLARWLTGGDHPLTARVMVNRIWQHLFGRGLVRTVDNFGAAGEAPSHPELLDHLALRFVEDGWSVKAMIRRIVLSRTYGLASTNRTDNAATDPDNVLLWRMSPRRLEAEAIRDSILAVAGTLDLTPPEASPLMRSGTGELGRRGPQAADPTARKRSVYLQIVRNAVPDMLCVFDFAEPSTVTGRREVTTVATQALFMMNNEFVTGNSAKAAERLLAAGPVDGPALADRAYRLALGRPATVSEQHRIASYARELGKPAQATWATVFQAIFASAEFRYVR